MEARTGKPSPKTRLQELLDRVMATRPTMAEFRESLAAWGVEVRANLAITGGLNGFSFSVDGIAFKGSSLGKAYGLPGLLGHGLSYDQERNGETLKRFSNWTAAPTAFGVGTAKDVSQNDFV
jgi:hypothetical protein